MKNFGAWRVRVKRRLASALSFRSAHFWKPFAGRGVGCPAHILEIRNAAVAEHALVLMLTCACKALLGHRAVAEAAYLKTGIAPTRTPAARTAGGMSIFPLRSATSVGFSKTGTDLENNNPNKIN